MGPEGGFEDKKREFIKYKFKSFENICLSSNILKADTAVIAALEFNISYFFIKIPFLATSCQYTENKTLLI